MYNPQQFVDSFRSFFNPTQFTDTARRNLESCSSAGQSLLECAQEIARRTTEIAQKNTQLVLNASKEMISSSTPEANVSRLTELNRTLLEGTLSNGREISEIVSKALFEATDKCSQRAAESFDELSSSARNAASQAAPKRKSA